MVTVRLRSRQIQDLEIWKLVIWGSVILFSWGTLCTTTVNAMDLDVQNANLSQVIGSLARSEGLNVVGVESLQGTVSARLHNLSAFEVIEKLGKTKNFEVRQEGSTIFISGSKNGIQKGEPFVITPLHMRPDKLQNAISSVIPKERSCILKETNQLIIYGNSREEKDVRALVKLLDTPAKQVQLTATVLAMESSYVKEAGLRWSWLGLTSHGSDSTNSYGAISFGKAVDGNSYKFFYKPELDALESTGKAVLVAAPNIMTINGEEAKILIGDRIPVLVETKQNGESSTTIRYEEAGIRLTYTPYLTEDDYIDAEVKAEVSTPTLVSEMKAYKITTREAQTRVRLKAGEVLVIGGLMDNREHKQKQKIPILGDIPLLGKLFQHARKSKDQVELFILLKANKVSDL